MESTRQKKVSRLIQKELADIFIKRGNEFAHGKLVSITRVRLSPDLSFAKVYISIFPATNQDDVLHSIEEHTQKSDLNWGRKSEPSSELYLVSPSKLTTVLTILIK